MKKCLRRKRSMKGKCDIDFRRGIINLQFFSAKPKLNNWETHELLAELGNIEENLALKIIQLFDDDFTIPFLCRYRKNLIENLSPMRLREIKDLIETIRLIETKSQNLLKSLQKETYFTEEIERDIKSAKSLDEIENLASLYKPPAKGSLFERAQKLGLEPSAENMLFGRKKVDLSKLIQSHTVGLQSIEEIEEGIKNIMSHLIAKHSQITKEVRELRKKYEVMIKTSQLKQKKSADSKKRSSTSDESNKFELYFNFSTPASRIKPHQILAINRGESLKVRTILRTIMKCHIQIIVLKALSIKYEVDERFEQTLSNFASKLFLNEGHITPQRQNVFNNAFNDAYRKKIAPYIIRQTKSELTKIAEKSAMYVFATNLKNLLLMNPVKRQKILGLDPGWKNGCKAAMISENGEVIETGVKFYLHDKISATKTVIELLQKFSCSLIAIGNGTACRETETFVAQIIEKKLKNVQYCIVSEQGASIYSCSDVAKKEFPDLDVSYIGAISIARRLQDPLCELVKIEAKHLGVGMYQHDLNEKALKKTLDEVIIECVSFVGVDLNIASFSLLKHVAGLTEKRAEAIVKYREDNGCFKSRSEILKVKSIGPKSFTQCAGFIRINGLSAGITKYDLLDATNVHPESYDLANKIIQHCKLKAEDIGKSKFVEKILEFRRNVSMDQMAAEFDENPERVRICSIV